MKNKVPVNVDSLRELAVLAIKNSTENAFIKIALDWAVAADKEIQRLKKLIKEKEDERNENRDKRDRSQKESYGKNQG